MADEPKPTPYTGPGFATRKPDHFRIIDEVTPSIMLTWHPGLQGMNLRPPNRAEIAQLYYQFTGKRPPASIAEWKAQLEAEGRTLPPYAVKYLEEHPEAE